MADLNEYSSEKLMQANEIELKQLLSKYKQEQMPLWKFGLFVGYNALALVGMYHYGVKLRGKRVEPSIKNIKKLTIANLFMKGVKHSVNSILGRSSWCRCIWLGWLWSAITPYPSLVSAS
jgi:hypothetical protein